MYYKLLKRVYKEDNDSIVVREHMEEQSIEKSKCGIGCVIVTFNRLNKLRKTLQSYANQISVPQYIIVVNNASTDGTGNFLEDWKKEEEGFLKIVIHSKENLGGSGGFYLGEQAAMKQNADWIMIADDDAYPDNNYINGIQQYIDSHKNDNISIICGRVIENDSFVNIHRSRWRSRWDRNFHTPVKEKEYNKKEFYPDFVSYVGIVINKQKMQTVGLVNKSNFIWCDDTEHTYRLGRVGKVICLPALSIFHDVEPMNYQLNWKLYYGIRNDLVFFKKHFPFHYPFILSKLLIKTLLSPLKGRSYAEIKLRFAAMRDSWYGNMGINAIYKPGWKA